MLVECLCQRAVPALRKVLLLDKNISKAYTIIQYFFLFRPNDISTSSSNEQTYLDKLYSSFLREMQEPDFDEDAKMEGINRKG